jgi:multicomponent Na+:H+ antiporter subunit D
MSLLGVLAIPAVSGLLLALCHRWPNVRDSVMVAGAVALFGAVLTAVRGDSAAAVLFEVLPGVPLGFALEPLGELFALVASGLYVITAIYTIGYLRGHHEENQTRFHVCFAVALFATLAVAFADNLLTLFLFYELLTLSTYPLVTHHGTDAARRAGRVYLGILLSTSILFLLGAVVWTYLLAGTLDFRPGGILAGQAGNERLAVLFLLFAYGAGKAALMPLHRWLPAAMVAPTPVSALLHAVAVVKVGVFTMLKVAVYVFGIDVMQAVDAGLWVQAAAGTTIVAASVIALTRTNLKERLAYSTISQLSYIVLGAALATPSAWLGGALHIAMHAAGKITLFFCAGAIYVAAHKTEISELDGLGPRMPFTFAAFGVASLCIIGLPPTGGAWSKWFLALGAVEAGRPWLVAVLLLSSLLNIAYLMPIPIRAFFSRPEEPFPPGRHEAPLFCVAPLCLTALACIGLFFGVEPMYRLVTPLLLVH